MAGPSTESLAEQIDRVRDQISAIKDEVQLARRESLDGSKRLGEIFADQLQDIRENMVRESTQLRGEVGAVKEAFKVEHSLIREDLARLQTQTSTLVDRFDRTQDFLKQLLFWFLGVAATIGGGLFWRASQAVNRLEEQGRRIESIEKANDGQAKLRDSVDQMRKALDDRLPARTPAANQP